jgi:Secretion system C-terminal sorting domain
MAHEVVPFDSIDGSLWYPYSIQWFTQLCDSVKNKSDIGDIWVGTVANVTRYLKERDNFHYNVFQYDSSQIQLEVDNNLNDEFYNHPLTIFVKVPDEWNHGILFIQGNIQETLMAFNSDSGNVVMANVIPGGNRISLYNILTGIDDDSPLVNKFELFPNYPNPFNPSTTIRYTIAEEHHVKLMIFDLLGNEIATLVNEEENGGSYSVNFTATNLASGVYIYSLKVDEHIITRKMTLIK